MRFRGLKILLLAVTAAAVLFLLCGAVKHKIRHILYIRPLVWTGGWISTYTE